MVNLNQSQGGALVHNEIILGKKLAFNVPRELKKFQLSSLLPKGPTILGTSVPQILLAKLRHFPFPSKYRHQECI